MELTDELVRINLKKVFQTFLRFAWLLVAMPLLCGLVAGSFAGLCLTPLYEASVMMYINNVADGSDSTSPITSSDLSAAQTLVDTYAVVLKSKSTLNQVIADCGLEYTYSELYDMVTAEAVNGTEILQVTVTGSDPAEITKIANALTQIATEDVAELILGSSVQVIDYADVPQEQAYPNVLQFAGISAAVGLALSCVFVLLICILENQAPVEEKIAAAYAIPALGVIPNLLPSDRKIARRKRNRTSSPAKAQRLLGEQLKSAPLEAYKLLRANLLCSHSAESGGQVIGVTSADDGEGKSTTAVNLSYVLAEDGQKVCLVEANLRTPSLAKWLRLAPEIGLTNLLYGEITGEQALQTVHFPAAPVQVMVAGKSPQKPSELLGSARMKKLISVLQESFDYVIVDLPPVTGVSDSAVSVRFLTGMLLVVREDTYERRRLAETMRQLRLSHANLLGFVMTRSTTREKERQRQKR